MSMAVIGVITNEGLSKTINAANKEGWNIYPTKFAISTNKGSLSPSRDTDSVGNLWFEAPVTSRRVISDNSIEFICNIPPNATNEDKEIGEIYLFGESSEEVPQEFLLALGQPSQALTYYFDGSISLRLIVTLTNINISDLFVFQYEDSVDIDEHNMDADAHPKLLKAVSQWVKGLGNALLRNGQLLSGGSLYTSTPVGGDITIRAEAAAMYVNGAVIYVPESPQLMGSASGVISFGVWVDNSGAEVGGDQDLTSPDAVAKWGTSYDPDAKGTFYEVYKISEGAVLEEEALLSDEAQELIGTIVRYDVDAHGNYAVNGLDVRLDNFTWDDTKDTTTYSISSGRAHVGGREIDLLHDLRREYMNAATTYQTNAEPVGFVPRADSTMTVALDFGPVEEIIEVIAPAKVTNHQLSRRNVGDLGDINENPVGVTSVQAITRVHNGAGTEYQKGIDWEYGNGGTNESVIYWLSEGPGKGGTFFVEFIYYTDITSFVTATGDRKGFDIPANIVPVDSPNGQPVELAEVDEIAGDQLYISVDYRWRMPRIDRLYLNPEGQLTLARGMASAFAPPRAPTLPNKALSLAEIYHTWWEDPELKLDGVKVVKMQDLNKMQRSISDLYDLVALERLKSDTSRNAPSATHGLFVDPMLDDDMRDLGMENLIIGQDGDIDARATINPAREELILPIDMNPNGLNPTKETKPWTLEYEHTVLIDAGNPVEQTEMTGSMKVNPYAAFKPIPAKMTLVPAVDVWTETKMNLKSGGSINSTVVNHGVYGFKFQGNVSSAKVGETTRALEFLRALDIEFTIEGFRPTEQIQSLTFDEVTMPVLEVDGNPVVADNNGVIKGKISIEGNTFTAGRKLVDVKGTLGTEAQASFTGKGTVTTEEWQTKFSGGFQRWDPLAQTFTLKEDHYMSGVDIKMTTIGSDQIVVQLRTTSVGIPDKTIAEVRVNPQDLLLYDTNTHHIQDPVIDGKPESYANPAKHGWTRITFDPTFIEAGTEYAFVVLTDDPDHEMAIAELGGVSEDGQVISAQAYQIGVMLSSSNATTWTPHQSADLTFRLLRAEFVNTEREIPLGSFNVNKLSDAMVVGGTMRPSQDSNITITFTDEDGRNYDMNENTPLRLNEEVSGSIAVKAKLTGTKHLTPLMWPELLMMLGSQAGKAVYCTRSFRAGDDPSTLSVKFEAELKGEAAVSVYYQDESSGSSQWVEMINPEKSQLDTDLYEYEYKASDFNDDKTRIMLVLSGSALHRPVVANLRAMAY
tara:strand:+ start:97631 stop:101389 length:3759 start_codon:yes stop_codon:yes gene_type:complete